MRYTIVLTILIFIACVFAYALSKKPYSGAVAAEDNIDNAIVKSMSYLSKSTLPSGRFVYNANVDPSVKYNQKKYNVLRHAGTLYAMYLCERYLKEDSLKEKRLLASKYLVDNYVKKISSDMYAVVSKPEEEKLQQPEAKVGGTGLALIGLSNLYTEGKIDLKILRGLGNFAIYMQNSDGSFCSKFNVEKGVKSNNFVSLYYPGEVAYGLLFLYEVDPQKKWLDTSKKALFFLANSRKDKGTDVPFDHWAMLATRKLFETPDNGLSAEEKKLLQKHAEQMANSILENQVTDINSEYFGSFKNNIRLCSLGTIMEGLVAIYYCTEDVELKKRVLNSLNLLSAFLVRYQVKDGEMVGGIPTRADWQKLNAEAKSRVIRIDNVQHVLSGWITYKQIGAEK